MNRRGFLALLGLSPAMYAVDKPSLWASVKRLFRPQDKHFHVSMNWVSPECIEILEAQRICCDRAYRDFAEEVDRHYKIGDIVRIKMPEKYKVNII